MFYRNLKILVALFLPWLIATSASCAELDVSELIAGMKQAIIEAQKTSEPPYMNLPWVEGEISYVVKKEGKGGFKLYVVTAEGKYATEVVHRVKFRLEPPSGKWRVEREGEFKDALISGVDPIAGRIFIRPFGEKEIATLPVKLLPLTKIRSYVDVLDASKTLPVAKEGTWGTIAKEGTLGTIVKEGTWGTIRYSTDIGGELNAKSITIYPHHFLRLD